LEVLPLIHPEELANSFPIHSSPLVEYIRLGLENRALPLTSGQPSLDAMDVDLISRCSARGIAENPRALLYGSNRGLGALRQQVLAWQASLGIAPREATEAHIMMTLGSQYGFHLLCQAMLQGGDPVAFDAPCYPDTWCTLLRHRARLVPIPVDQDGMDLDRLEEHLRTKGPVKMVYTILNHQNPSGCSMSPQRQARLMDLADRYRFLVAVDDPYRLLDLDPVDRNCRAEIPQLGFETGLVVYLGSFSKILSPGIRLGWLMGHPSLVEGLAKLQEMTMISLPAADSTLALQFLKEGHMGPQLERVRSFLRVRRQALAEGLSSQGLTFHSPKGGCFLNLPVEGASEVALRLVKDKKVATVPERAFWPNVEGARDSFLRLSYSWCSPEELKEAAERIGETLREMDRA